jgi:hypothetical protein
MHLVSCCVLQDAVFQYTRKNNAGTFKFKQVVPNLSWEVVPSPVVEVSSSSSSSRQEQLLWRQLVHQ